MCDDVAVTSAVRADHAGFACARLRRPTTSSRELYGLPGRTQSLPSHVATIIPYIFRIMDGQGPRSARRPECWRCAFSDDTAA